MASDSPDSIVVWLASPTLIRSRSKSNPGDTAKENRSAKDAAFANPIVFVPQPNDQPLTGLDWVANGQSLVTPAADGTVDALGAGDTETKIVKAQPGEFSGQALLKDVRMGVHPEFGGWDRIVFEFSGPNLPPATIGYVPVATQCGSGAGIPLQGTAVLNVRFSQAAAHDQSAQTTFAPRALPGAGTTIISASASCDFEGVVSWAAGIKAKQPFKVSTLQNPSRLVIDVKH